MPALEPKAGDQFMIPSPGFDPAPSLWVVAVIALRAKLQLVGVILSPRPVVGLASQRRSGQNTLEVAIPALHGTVLTYQGKFLLS